MTPRIAGSWAVYAHEQGEMPSHRSSHEGKLCRVESELRRVRLHVCDGREDVLLGHREVASRKKRIVHSDDEVVSRGQVSIERYQLARNPARPALPVDHNHPRNRLVGIRWPVDVERHLAIAGRLHHPLLVADGSRLDWANKLGEDKRCISGDSLRTDVGCAFRYQTPSRSLLEGLVPSPTPERAVSPEA